MLPNITDKVWMVIHIDGTKVGTIEFGLFGTNSPAAVENFLSLVKCHPGTKGKLSGKSLCYKGSTIHRVIPNFAFQGGDVTHGDGTGGESIHGGRMSLRDDQKEQVVKFTRPKLLANAGNRMDFGSQFFVTTVKTQWLTGKHVAFGRVLNDPDNVITEIEQVGTYGGKTKATITIYDAGIGTLTEADKKPHY
jgi:peptidylprolyl isomerase